MCCDDDKAIKVGLYCFHQQLNQSIRSGLSQIIRLALKSMDSPRSFPQTSQDSAEGQSAGKWGEIEHQRFLEAYQRHPNHWALISDFVKTRTVSQVRSHAQKYFNKLSYDKEKIGFQKLQLRGQNDISITRSRSRRPQICPETPASSHMKYKLSLKMERSERKSKNAKKTAEKREKEISYQLSILPHSKMDQIIEQDNEGSAMDVQSSKDEPIEKKEEAKPVVETQNPFNWSYKKEAAWEQPFSQELMVTTSAGTATSQACSVVSSFFMNKIYPRLDPSHIENFSVFTMIDENIPARKEIQRSLFPCESQ